MLPTIIDPKAYKQRITSFIKLSFIAIETQEEKKIGKEATL